MPASPSPKQTPALGMMLDALATMSSGLTMMSSAIEMMSEEATAKVENDSEKPVSPLVLPVRDSLNTASETEITAVPAGKGPSAQIEKNYMNALKIQRMEKGFQMKPTLTKLRREYLPEREVMQKWLEMIGYSGNEMKVINVVGTKGKGTTSNFTSVLLQAYAQRIGFPKIIGLYTKPAVITRREMIRINSVPLSEESFAKYWFEVYDILDSKISNTSAFPRLFQVLPLVAYHAFISEGVEAAIFEANVGGENCATSVFQSIVVGFVAIGLDHVNSLGGTIEEIAWQKGGIMKSGSPAFSTMQEEKIAAILQQRADEKKVELKFVKIDPRVPICHSKLEPDVLKLNLSVAINLAEAFLKRQKQEGKEKEILTSKDIAAALDKFNMLGRFQIVKEGKHEWFLDLAHNVISVPKAVAWFASYATKSLNAPKILIYFQTPTKYRDSWEVLGALVSSLKKDKVVLKKVILATRVEKECKITEKSIARWTKIQEEYVREWKRLDPDVPITSRMSVEGAMNLARSLGKDKGMQTLMMDFSLVGNALRQLGFESS